MLVTDDLRVKRAGGGVQRVNSRIDTHFRNGTVQHRGRVKMGEGRGGRRIGQVIGGDVNGLHRGDRTLLGRGDAFLQRAHFRRQCRLVAHGGGDTAQQRGHFGASLRETEDVIDEEQHVLAFDIAEVFRNRHTGQGDTGTRARRFVHLAIDQRHLGPFGRIALKLDDARVLHFVIQVVTFTGTFTDTGKDRHAAMRLGDVVDQFLNDDGLAHAGATEQADLTALEVRAQQVNHLDARGQDFGCGGLLVKRRGGTVNGGAPLARHRATVIDRVTDHVQDTAQRAGTDRHGDLGAGGGHFRAAGQAISGIHGNAANFMFTDFLRHFQHQGLAVQLNVQCFEDMRQRTLELNVNNGAADLRHATNDIAFLRLRGDRSLLSCGFRHGTAPVSVKIDPQTAWAPEMISISSLVILV